MSTGIDCFFGEGHMRTSRFASFKHARYAALAVLLPALITAASDRPAPPPPAAAPVPLFEGLGPHQRPVNTSSPEAQRYFDQGLIFAFAFNHDEAIRSFTQAARLDPQCAMAWWGIALSSGPHINNAQMSPAQSQAAWDALQNALALQDQARPTDRALIQALAHRYAASPPENRRPLDEAYAAAMREVWLAHRDDADVGSLYAESLMDLRPWDLWTVTGQPQPGTQEIVSVLEEVLQQAPEHPGANHFYIHAIEASPDPGKALASADRLTRLVPAAGHLVHMPAHIYARTGHWEKAAEANERAITADQQYRAISPHQAFYRIYMAHNHHFLAFASMMEGRSAEAIDAARDMIAGIPPEFVQSQAAQVDGFMPIAIEVLMRFGRWQEILNEPPPPEYLPITTAMWRFARGVSYAALGQVRLATQEQAAFRLAVTDVPPGAMLMVNPATDMLAVADHMLAGEIAFRRGDIDTAVSDLRVAVELEDKLRYMEPPEWIQPVRHALGAILLSAGRAAEAEAVYREDLQRWPENGWSLYGLAAALRQRGAESEAAEVQRRFAQAWSRADYSLKASCSCAAH
jgi:tetratricopeptide (TPR) repeat protein